MTAPDRSQRRAAYLAATAAADGHMDTCGACRAGRSCGTGDDLMEAEYRRGEALRTADPYTYRRLDRATHPTEEG